MAISLASDPPLPQTPKSLSLVRVREREWKGMYILWILTGIGTLHIFPPLNFTPTPQLKTVTCQGSQLRSGRAGIRTCTDSEACALCTARRFTQCAASGGSPLPPPLLHPLSISTERGQAEDRSQMFIWPRSILE